jgi:hypothetical protein
MIGVPEGVVMGVPEEQGTVMVVLRVTIVVDALALTDEAVLVETVEAVVIVVNGVQPAREKVPLKLPEPP